MFFHVFACAKNPTFFLFSKKRKKAKKAGIFGNFWVFLGIFTPKNTQNFNFYLQCSERRRRRRRRRFQLSSR